MSYETMAKLRRRPCSPPAAPLEDDDLLSEILLRLPPQPSSLPRASAVCKRWRGLVSDPRFSRRFRIRHRRNPPLLGYFLKEDQHDPRMPPRPHAPLPRAADQLLVWDPVTGDQNRLDIPPGFDTVKSPFSGAVLRAAGDFQVVLVGNSDMQMQHTQLVASLYSSKIGEWGTLVPPGDSSDSLPTWVYPSMPAVMVGDSLYWLLVGNFFGILEFHLDRRSLALIPTPRGETPIGGVGHGNNLVIPTEGGGLGFLVLLGFSAQVWERKTIVMVLLHGCWDLGRTIALGKLLSIIGFAEDNNVVLLRTCTSIFTLQLESWQLKKLLESNGWYSCYPFEGVYTADNGIGGGRDGAELLQNA
ncbi:unnamed protein product [Alopecurus aequalis]